VVELDDGHGDGGDQKMIQCFTFEKNKEKNKNGLKAKVYVIEPFFCTQDTIEDVSDLGSIAILLGGKFLVKMVIKCH
jgi:hypothetical protein